MRYSLTAAFLTIVFSAAAQTPDLPFERRYEVPSALWTRTAVMDGEGSIYTATEVNPDKNIQVTKVLADATHAWTKVYPYFVEMGLYNNCMAMGPEGLIVGAYAMGTGTSSRDGLILRIDPEDGTLLQSTRIDVGGQSNAIHGITRINGGFMVAGRAYGAGGMYDMLMAKLDDSGTMLWSKTYGSSGWDWAEEALPTADGGFVLVGYGDSLLTNLTPPGAVLSPAGYVVRTDALGNELWARSISSGARPDQPSTAAVGTDGSIYVGGRSLGYGNLTDAGSITKISATGDHLWTRFVEGGIEVHRLLPLANGGVAWLLQPHLFPGGPGGYDMAWGTIDAGGNLSSSHYHGSGADEYPTNFFLRNDGGFVILGPATLGTSTTWELSVIQTDADGNSECNDVNLPLTWLPATALVRPFTSATASGFEAFPYPIGTQDVAVGVSNPCCIENAAFTMAPHGAEGYSWIFTDASTGANSYLWDFGDGQTSTEQSPIHVYAANGSYNVCLTITGDCGQATSCQTINIAVGIDGQEALMAGISLHPSPASSSFTIRSKRVPIDKVQLLDAAGRQVRMNTIERRNRVEVAVDHVPAGLYVARTTLTDGTVHHQRVLIVH